MSSYNKRLLEFYENNDEELDTLWEEYVSFGEWGSGLDKIKITDDMFWEFVEDKYNEGL